MTEKDWAAFGKLVTLVRNKTVTLIETTIAKTRVKIYRRANTTLIELEDAI